MAAIAKPGSLSREAAVGRVQTGGCAVIFAYAVLIIWALLSLMPLFWMISISLSNVVTLLKMPPALLPNPIIFDNYGRLFNESMFPRWLLNSLFVTITNTVVSLFISSFYGYIFAKKTFPGSKLLFRILVSTIMVPFFVVVIPVFLMFRNFQLLNTHWALIIPSIFSAFGVFLMRQTIKTLPNELLDAARIDGCGEFGVYRRIVLPLIKPGLAVLAIFTFVNSWNDFFWPLIVLNNPQMYTLPVGLPTLQGQWIDYGLVMAASTAAAMPTIIIFLAFQRYFLQGVTVGALKG